MRFRAIWLRAALAPVSRAYAELFQAGADAEAITRAMARIDEVLERDPLNQGKSRSPGERIPIETPLSVRYEVHEDEKVVAVWRAVYRPRRS